MIGYISPFLFHPHQPTHCHHRVCDYWCSFQRGMKTKGGALVMEPHARVTPIQEIGNFHTHSIRFITSSLYFCMYTSIIGIYILPSSKDIRSVKKYDNKKKSTDNLMSHVTSIFFFFLFFGFYVYRRNFCCRMWFCCLLDIYLYINVIVHWKYTPDCVVVTAHQLRHGTYIANK